MEVLGASPADSAAATERQANRIHAATGSLARAKPVSRARPRSATRHHHVANFTAGCGRDGCDAGIAHVNTERPGREADILPLSPDSGPFDEGLMTHTVASGIRTSPSFMEWSQRIPTSRGDPLDYGRFPFQPEVYRVFGDPDVKDVVAMKGVQLGMSELCVRLTLYFADVFALTSLYVFPAVRQMNDFSDTRVNRLIENSSYLRERTQSNPLNKSLKRVGDGYCHYRGSESNRDLLAIDADVVALDEYDSLSPENIPDAERRISASALGLIRRIGVPTDPEFGIGRLYAQSDRRQWHVRCKACTEWQPLAFDTNVSWVNDGELIENACVVCRRCRRQLDVGAGEWVAEFPDRDRPGFHVHQLLRPDANLVSLIEASQHRQPHLVRSFWTKDLGLPYTERTSGLDRTAIAAAISAGKRLGGTPLEMAHGYDGSHMVTAGIDVASTRALNVRISEHLDPLTQQGHRKRALWIGTVDSFDELPALISRFNVTFAVIDHMPEWRLAQLDAYQSGDGLSSLTLHAR